MLSCQVLTGKLPQINQNMCLLNELKKLKRFDSIYFEEDGAQSYSVFQLMYKCL